MCLPSYNDHVTHQRALSTGFALDRPINAYWDASGSSASLDSHSFDHGETFDVTHAGLNYSGLNYPAVIQGFALPPAANAVLPEQPPIINSLPRVSHNPSHNPTTGDNATGFVCLYPGCHSAKLFTRSSDLARHMKSRHCRPEFDCSVEGCNRKGEKGFPRKDKLGDHMRQKHRMHK